MKRMKELALRPDCPERERAYADALAVLLMDGPVKAREAWKTICSTWKRDPYAPLFYAMLLRDGFDGQGNPGEGQKEAVRVVEDVLKERPGSQAALFMRALLEEVAPSISPATVETARRAVSANPFPHPPIIYWAIACSAREIMKGHPLRSRSLKICAWPGRRRKTCLPRLMTPTSVPSFTVPFPNFCAGRYKRAEAIASRAASVPLDKKHPLAPGTLLQLWEARTLPAAPDAGPARPSPAGPCAQGFSGPSPQRVSGFEQRHDRSGLPIHGRMLRRKARQNGRRGVRL